MSVEIKLEILSKLSENLKIDFHSKRSNKEKLLDELFGAWSHLNGNLSNEILSNRNNSNREITFE